uniref:Uncharacterized protein n=1 Tax=Rhizophora mucronata TaxID=61149 RepID=A0A2P2QNL5_RHIMU
MPPPSHSNAAQAPTDNQSPSTSDDSKQANHPNPHHCRGSRHLQLTNFLYPD